MLQAIFFFIALGWLESRFSDGGNQGRQDWRHYFFEEFIDKEDKK